MPAFKIPKLKIQSNTLNSTTSSVTASISSQIVSQQQSITAVAASVSGARNKFTSSSSSSSTPAMNNEQNEEPLSSSQASSRVVISASSSSTFSTTRNGLHHQFRSVQPSFIIAEDDDGALSVSSPNFESSSFEQHIQEPSNVDAPLDLSELCVVAPPVSVISIPLTAFPSGISNASSFSTKCLSTTTHTSSVPTATLPAFQLPTRAAKTTGNTSSHGGTSVNSSAAARRRRKSGANTAVLSVSDPTGQADILDHPALPVSDSEDEEEVARKKASKRPKPSSTSSTIASSSISRHQESTATVSVSSASSTDQIMSTNEDLQGVSTSTSVSTVINTRRKNTVTTGTTSTSITPASATGKEKIINLVDTNSTSVSIGTKKRTRVQKSNSATVVIETNEAVSIEQAGMHIDPRPDSLSSIALNTHQQQQQQQSLPALARLHMSTSLNATAEAQYEEAAVMRSSVVVAVNARASSSSSSFSSSSSSSTSIPLFRVRRGGCGKNLVSSVVESDDAFATRLGTHVSEVLKGVSAFITTQFASSLSALSNFKTQLTRLSDELSKSDSSIGAAFSIPLYLIASTTDMTRATSSSSSSKTSPVFEEVNALSVFLKCLVSAERLCSPEITAINERNIQRNDKLNTGKEDKKDRTGIQQRLDQSERPVLTVAFLSQQSQSMDEDDTYTGSASNSPIQVGSTYRDGDPNSRFGGSAFGFQRQLLPPPCTPLRQVSSSSTTSTTGESLTPERSHKKNHTVRFSSYDFSAVNAAPPELTSVAIPAPFSSKRSPRSIAMGGSAADEQMEGTGGLKRDMIESGCVVFALTDVLSAARKLKEVLTLQSALSPSISLGLGLYEDKELDFDNQIALLRLEKHDQVQTTTSITSTTSRSFVSITAPIMQLLCAMSQCSSANQWEVVVQKALNFLDSSSSSVSLLPPHFHIHGMLWSTLRGASRFHAKELSQLRSEHLDLPMTSSLSNALSSSARYHLRRALNPHVYDDDGEPGTIVDTGVRPIDITATPPPASSLHNPQKLLILDGISHHHHHHHRPVAQNVQPISKLSTRASLCGGFGRGAGGIQDGFIAMARTSGNFHYNNDDLAAVAHEALRSLYLSRKRVETIIAPHSLVNEETDFEDSNTPIAQPLSLHQLIDACSLDDLGCVYQFSESHSFLRSLFGHEQAIAALATDGECWKKLRTLARIAEEYGCESERHLLPLASISSSALTSLIQEGETVDKLHSLAQLTLDRHMRGLEAARPRPKRSSTGNATGGGGIGGGSAPASPNGHGTTVSTGTHEDNCTGRNGLSSRDTHDRPRKKRHAHSRLASPSPLDRQRFLELVVGSGSIDDDDEDGHYPEPVPPMKLDLLMQTEGNTSCMVDNEFVEKGSGGGGTTSGMTIGTVCDVLNTSNGCDTESSGGGTTSTGHSTCVSVTTHGGISSRFSLLGTDTAAIRAQSLLDHEDIIDKKLRFVFPRVQFLRCSSDARHVYDDNTDFQSDNNGQTISPSQFISGLGGSLNNSNPTSCSTTLQQTTAKNIVNLNFRLSAAPIVVKTSAAATMGVSNPFPSLPSTLSNLSTFGVAAAPLPSLTLDDLMADVLRFPGNVSQDSSPQTKFENNSNFIGNLSASASTHGAAPLFFSSTQGGFAPSPFSAAFSTLSLLAPSVITANASSSLVTDTDCGECKRSLQTAPSNIIDMQWSASASPGSKRREKMLTTSRSSSSSTKLDAIILVVKCASCKVSFHADCVGRCTALESWKCQSCTWK